jgi:hypothetical protein
LTLKGLRVNIYLILLGEIKGGRYDPGKNNIKS